MGCFRRRRAPKHVTRDPHVAPQAAPSLAISNAEAQQGLPVGEPLAADTGGPVLSSAARPPVPRGSRPSEINDASDEYAKSNCSLVTMAAVLGVRSSELVQWCGWDPSGQRRWYQPKAALHDAAWAEARLTKAQGAEGGLKEKIPGGGLDLGGTIDPDRLGELVDKEARPEPNDLMMARMATLGQRAGFSTSFGGTPSEMLDLEAGIAEMRSKPAGTCFAVFLTGKDQAHYVFAERVEDVVRFTDYQPRRADGPLGYDVGDWEQPDAHPQADDRPTPVPFDDGSGAFDQLCFVAFLEGGPSWASDP